MKSKIMDFNSGRIKSKLDDKPYCIAEVGLNHNGDINIAKQMIEAAKHAGADAVKFQTFRAEEFCGDAGQLFKYKSQGKLITEPMLEMFKRYEFAVEEWKNIKASCDDAGIDFFSTPQNRSDLEILLDVGVPVVKVGSDDFTNLPLLKSYSETELPLILSCGMSDISEVHMALSTVGWYEGYPVALMLCTSQYPTPAQDVNLNKLRTLRDAFPGLMTGFSDHTQGALAAPIAVALGARVFEKHFTLGQNMPGPDHWFSEEPAGLKVWVENIKEAHTMMGSSYVKPTQKELLNKREFQRVIVAAKQIRKGERFSSNNVTMRRVAGGEGFAPALYESLLGGESWRDFEQYDPIKIK